MTLYRTIQAGRRGILILAFFAVRWSAKAPAATILLPHMLHGWAWVHHWLRPAWTVCATSSAKRSRVHKKSSATSCGVMGKPARSTTMPRERGVETQQKTGHQPPGPLFSFVSACALV